MGYSDYQYDPNQVFDPNNIPPPPPGYGDKGGNYLLPDENNPNPAYLPQNPDGSTSNPQTFGPEPPIFYATNVPGTAQKWGKQGHNYTFLAESPAAAKTAQDIGAPTVMKGYDPALDQAKPAAVGPEPKPGELDDFSKAQGFWKHVVDTEYGGADPTKINPAEVGMLKRAELQKKYDLELFNRGAGTTEYKDIQKHIDQQVKDAESVAERQRAGAAEKMKEVIGFAKSQLSDERKIAAEKRKATVFSHPVVQAAQKFTFDMMQGPQSAINYDLSPEDQATLRATGAMPAGRRLKPEALTEINRNRQGAGLPPIIEKPAEIPLMESRNWGPLGQTTPTQTGVKKGYLYESAPDAGAGVPRGTAPGGSIPTPPPIKGATPPAKTLKEGIATHYNNGQVWALQGGQPVRIK